MTSSLIRNILKNRTATLTASLVLFSLSRYSSGCKDLKIHPEDAKLTYKKQFTHEELKKRLTSLQYYVTQEKGTERPFSGDDLFASEQPFTDAIRQKESGDFACVVCGQNLFSSKTKFESGSGWPSFYDVINSDRVNLIEDNSYGMRRIECVCSSCGAHLGHLFNDGPKPTNLRYCINSASLEFVKNKE